ncbi:hypothetical protein F5Y08DRAFT_351163 [Xylaria arbuscula]|nr:hypothetical protein F5Y08DRAFT_351163 [Xylaria arbuscula]
MVQKVWLGFGGAYVIDRYDGSQEWDLKGYYGDLKKRIKKGIYGCQKIQDLAMNIENPACYAIIMTNGGSDYMAANEFPESVWRKYMKDNFGVRWRRRRE